MSNIHNLRVSALTERMEHHILSIRNLRRVLESDNQFGNISRVYMETELMNHTTTVESLAPMFISMTSDREQIIKAKIEEIKNLRSILTGDAPLEDRRRKEIEIENKNLCKIVIRLTQEHMKMTSIIALLPFIRSAPLPIRGPVKTVTEKSKVIAKKKLEEPCPSECAICQETPKHKDAVCTSCDHYYCKSCLDSWMKTKTSKGNCPLCRQVVSLTTSFRARAPRTKKLESSK